MASMKKSLVGRTYKDDGNRYLFVEAQSPRGGYDVCEYFAEPDGSAGARVFAIGEHSEGVTRGYLESLTAAEGEVADEVAYRNAYRTKYYETWHVLCLGEPDGDAREHARRANDVAFEATKSLRELVYR